MSDIEDLSPPLSLRNAVAAILLFPTRGMYGICSDVSTSIKSLKLVFLRSLLWESTFLWM